MYLALALFFLKSSGFSCVVYTLERKPYVYFDAFLLPYKLVSTILRGFSHHSCGLWNIYACSINDAECKECVNAESGPKKRCLNLLIQKFQLDILKVPPAWFSWDNCRGRCHADDCRSFRYGLSMIAENRRRSKRKSIQVIVHELGEKCLGLPVFKRQAFNKIK